MPEQTAHNSLPQGRGGYARWFGLAGLVVILDQWAKYAILDHFAYGETLPVTSFFNLILTYNQGAAFGMLHEAGGWQRWLFTLLGLGASAWMAYLLRKHAGQKLFCFALALIMGGALGNVIDRFVHDGKVVDFLDFHWDTAHFAAFNLADSAITCGAILLLLEGVINSRKARDARPAPPGE